MCLTMSFVRLHTYIVAYKTLYVSYLGKANDDQSIVSHDCIFHNLFFLSVFKIH